MKANNSGIMTINESLQWISIITLSVLSYFRGYKFTLILIFWVVDILITGNARRIYSEKYKNIFMAIRRSIYPITMILPMLAGVKVSWLLSSLNWVLWVIIGTCVGIVFILTKYSDWRLLLSYDMISFSCIKSQFDYITMAIITFGNAICEEYFFRNFIITYTMQTIGIFSIILSLFLFFLHHFGVKWADSFDKYDFIIQLLFGLISGILFYISKSIIPSLCAHLTYNMPRILLNIRSYIYFYHKNKNISKEKTV